MKNKIVTRDSIAQEIRDYANERCSINYNRFQHAETMEAEELQSYAEKLAMCCTQDSAEIVLRIDPDVIFQCANYERDKTLSLLTEAIISYYELPIYLWYHEGVEIYEQGHKINTQEMHGIPQRGE